MIQLYLFQISTPQLANVMAAISAAATVGALWYAYHRNRVTDKRQNDLANVVLELQNQVKIQQNQLNVQMEQVGIHRNQFDLTRTVTKAERAPIIKILGLPL
jgi:hypothetical protein